MIRECAEVDIAGGPTDSVGTLWNSPLFIGGVVLILVTATAVVLVLAIRSSGRPPWR